LHLFFALRRANPRHIPPQSVASVLKFSLGKLSEKVTQGDRRFFSSCLVDFEALSQDET